MCRVEAPSGPPSLVHHLIGREEAERAGRHSVGAGLEKADNGTRLNPLKNPTLPQG